MMKAPHSTTHREKNIIRFIYFLLYRAEFRPIIIIITRLQQSFMRHAWRVCANVNARVSTFDANIFLVIPIQNYDNPERDYFRVILFEM